MNLKYKIINLLCIISTLIGIESLYVQNLQNVVPTFKSV